MPVLNMCTVPVPKHVLVVDDYLDAANILAVLLRAASPTALTTDVGYDGAQAVALAVNHPPNLALLDIDMPVMNGIDAAMAIRASLGAAAPLIVAMTGDSGHLASTAAAAAFDKIFIKPVDIEEILALVTAS